MAKQKADPDRQAKSAILYGMQRTGSNYIQQVLLQNYENIRFFNSGFARCLPTHKHFRLYDEKVIIPDVRYYNSFTYRGFAAFKEHVEQVAGQQIDLFVVCIKDPYSWYISYKKHARKNKYTYFRKALNSHYIIDYNLFYRNWFDFSREAPDKVMLLRYEDFLGDLDGKLQEIAGHYGLERAAGSSVNPDKVPMSKRFTAERASYYRNSKYLDLISERELSIIQHLLDPEVFHELGYEIVKVQS
jgi:hypothetical protein